MPEEPLIQRYVYRGHNPSRPKIVTRSYTKNARHPSPAQATQRLRVGEIAKSAKGMKMKEGDALPPVARLVKRFTSTPTGVQTIERTPVWKQELLDYIDMRTGAETEKEKMLEEINEILERVGA